MLDETENVTDEAAVTETESADQDEVTSSTESPTQGETTGQAETQPDVDPLQVLESLQLDPKIKENLKNGYLRQADYTKKTQEIAEQRKLIDEYTQVRPLIEYLGKNPDIFNELYGKMQGGQQPQGQEEIPQDPKAYAEWVKAETIKEFQAIQARDQDFREASKVDPRLDADPEFGEAVAKMVANDSDFQKGTITAAQATQKAVAWFDKYIAKQVTDAKNSLSQKAKLKRSGSTVPTIPGSVSSRSMPNSIMEAAKMAEEEL